MDISKTVDKLKEAADTQLEVCYALLAIHIRNIDEISTSIEEMEDSEHKDRMLSILEVDYSVVKALMGELETLEEDSD